MCPHSPSLGGPYRRFSVQRCARCHLGISASEMVMRDRDLVYHLNWNVNSLGFITNGTTKKKKKKEFSLTTKVLNVTHGGLAKLFI